MDSDLEPAATEVELSWRLYLALGLLHGCATGGWPPLEDMLGPLLQVGAEPVAEEAGLSWMLCLGLFPTGQHGPHQYPLKNPSD